MIINCYCERVPLSPVTANLTGGRVSRGARTILRDVTLTLPPGSLTVVTGSNGSGKSTLLMVLAGLHRLDTGSLALADGARRAFVPQRSAASDTLPLTVAEVVGMGRWGTGQRRDRREDRAITASCVNDVGLGGLEKRTLGTLSGGQRQRAFVAQGLAQKADILLLDEPTAALDQEARLLLAQCIDAERNRGAAVVLATHDLEDLSQATQRVHLGRDEPPAPTPIARIRETATMGAGGQYRQ